MQDPHGRQLWKPRRRGHDSFSTLKTSNLVTEIKTYFYSTLPSSLNVPHFSHKKLLTVCKLWSSSVNGQRQFGTDIPHIRDFWSYCDYARRNKTVIFHHLMPVFSNRNVLIGPSCLASSLCFQVLLMHSLSL